MEEAGQKMSCCLGLEVKNSMLVMLLVLFVTSALRCLISDGCSLNAHCETQCTCSSDALRLAYFILSFPENIPLFPTCTKIKNTVKCLHSSFEPVIIKAKRKS